MELDKSLKIIQANIRRKISRRKSSSSKKSVFIEEYIASEPNDRTLTATKISKFLKSKLIVDKYTLDNRVAYFNYIRKKLDKIKDDDCIDKKEYSHGEGYTIRNILNIEKKISANNFGGEVYRTSVKNAVGVFPIATKIMKKSDDNLYEVKFSVLRNQFNISICNRPLILIIANSYVPEATVVELLSMSIFPGFL